jgi:L-lactate dehydrogenase complex protein LldG
VENENTLSPNQISEAEKIERLKELMEGMRTEVHVVKGDGWVDALGEILRTKGLSNLLYAPGTAIASVLEKHWEKSGDGDGNLPQLIPFGQTVEDFKGRLFGVDAAITTSKGAIADAGAIILWPDETEPRTMSLVPPVHLVVLDADTIYNDLSEAMAKEDWHEAMPTNALLISGPSKTADIELILAFGVHGPKELVVLIRTQCHKLKSLADS